MNGDGLWLDLERQKKNRFGAGSFQLKLKEDIKMGMLSRVVRIWKADIHGVMDEFEDKGLVLKQGLRDMEDEMEKKEMQLKQLETSRDQAGRKYDAAAERYGKLDDDLASGLVGGHDKICRTLIRRLKEEEKLMASLEDYRQDLASDIDGLRQVLAGQHRQYQDCLARSREFFLREEQQNWQEGFAGLTGDKFGAAVSDEEVEVELLRRKAAMGRQEAEK